MKRAKFLKGKQNKFIFAACSNLSLKQFLKLSKLKISYSALKRYAREILTLPLPLAEKIAKISNQKLSDYKIKLLDENWGASKGGKRGIKVMMSKYKDKLQLWRRRGAKALAKYSIPKKIKKPQLNEELAEFIGVYLGDGTLTKYFVRIFGDKRYDLHYFNYLASLVYSIIGIQPKIRIERSRNLLILDIRSKLFCDYLKNDFGFKDGCKIRNKVVIPEKIIRRKELLFSCLRGLIDTDGSIAKDGETLCIRFRSHNPLIIEQLAKLNEQLTIFTFQYKTVIGTRNVSKINYFFKTIGSSNLSNIIRYCEFKKGNLIKKEETLKYIDLYKNVRIPYGPLV